jgi:hypothetical protein
VNASVLLAPADWVRAYVRWCFSLHIPQDTFVACLTIFIVYTVGYGHGVKKGWHWEARMREWAHGLETDSDGRIIAVPRPRARPQDRVAALLPRRRASSREVPGMRRAS